MTTVKAMYGRRYLTEAEALSAWDSGKDFRQERCQSGTYCSHRDFDKDTQVVIRWGRYNEEITIGYGKELNVK